MRKKQLLAAIDGLNDLIESRQTEIALKEMALQAISKHLLREIARKDEQIDALRAIIAHQDGASADDAMVLVRGAS